jgi:hypothetical protein
LSEILKELLNVGAGLGGDLGKLETQLLDLLGSLGGRNFSVSNGHFLPLRIKINLVTKNEYRSLFTADLLDVLYPLDDVAVGIFIYVAWKYYW